MGANIQHCIQLLLALHLLVLVAKLLVVTCLHLCVAGCVSLPVNHDPQRNSTLLVCYLRVLVLIFVFLFEETPRALST